MSNETIERTLGGLDAKMDALMDSLTEHRVHSERRHEDHEGRIRKIEEKQTLVAGMAATVGVGASVAWGWLKEHLK